MPEIPSPAPYVAIVYFTDEEHEILTEYFGAKPTDFGFPVEVTGVSFYEATSQIPTYGPKFYLINGPRAPIDALKFSMALITHAKPILAINIGTAGLLDDSLPIGSIIMPSTVTPWDDDAAIGDSPVGLGLQTNGKSVETKQPIPLSSQFSTQFPESFQIWERECKSMFKELNDALKKVPVTIECPPKIVRKCLASGSVVVKNKQLKAQIKKSRRGLVAVDMESYALTSVLNNKVPLMIIRTVTDPSTEEAKADLDDCKTRHKGRNYPTVRLFSLTCAAALVKHIVPKHSAYEKEQRELIEAGKVSPFEDHLPERLRSMDDSARQASLPAYSRYFSIAGRKSESDNFFKDLYHTITTNNGNFKIAGTPGSGKSTLLSCLYTFHLNEWRKDSNQPKPHYIDIQHYIINNSDYGILADLELLDTLLTKNGQNVLYIDGHDDYIRDSGIRQLNLEYRKFLLKHPGLKQVYAFGITDKPHGLVDEESGFPIDATELLRIEPCHASDPVSPQFINSFSTISTRNGDYDIDSIINRAKSMDLKDFDLFIFSLLTDRGLFSSYAKAHASLGTVYFDFIKKEIEEICWVQGTEAEAYLKRLAECVFHEQVVKEANGWVDNNVFATDFKWMACSRKLKQFVYRHPTLRQFLIAEHVLDICLSTPDALGYRIYTHGVNRFLKTLANRTERVRNELFAGILDLMENTPNKPLSQAHLAYLLGRLNLGNNDKERANTKLKEYLDKALRNYETIAKKQRNETDSVSRDDLDWSMLLLRTLYISLVYQGSMPHAETYVQELLRNPEWDFLNSGFHLQYYGDLPSGLQRLNMVAKDKDFFVEPTEVHKILCGDLDGYIQKRVFLARSFVELHTLLSLHVNRHLKKLLPERLRAQCFEKVSKFVQLFRDKLPEWYQGYVDQALEALAITKNDGTRYIETILGLKDQLRSGWVFEGYRDQKNVVRKVTREMRAHGPKGLRTIPGCQPESVADHSWACAMLAWTTLSEEDGVNVDRVIQLLLIHDLPEAITGDKVTSVDDLATKQAATKLAAMGYLRRFCGARHWSDLFAELEKKDTPESRIAHDIDKIERYIQAFIYSQNKSNVISDLEDWRPVKLLSRHGARLRDEIDNDIRLRGVA